MNVELIEPVVALAEKAGEAILDIYQEGDEPIITTKSDTSPLTEADMAAHQVIVSGLEQIAPQIPVLSEESEIPAFEVRSRWRRFWLVDPLDGTKEFIHRNGEFTVNIALIEDQLPVFGVVRVPVSRLTYVGVAGLGAFRRQNSQQRKIVTRCMAERSARGLPVAVVTSRRHGVEDVKRLIGRMASKLGGLETRQIGSSLKLCLVAEGQADFYPRSAPTCEWDTAAAQAVVEAAGGAVVDQQLRALRYNTRDSLQNPPFFVIGDTGFDWAPIIG